MVVWTWKFIGLPVYNLTPSKNLRLDSNNIYVIPVQVVIFMVMYITHFIKLQMEVVVDGEIF